MTTERVVKILKFYNTIPSEIVLRRNRINELEDRYDTLGTVNMDGMPRSGAIGDQTGNAVIRLDANHESALSEIKGLEDEIFRLQNLEQYIFCSLKQLPYHPKMVVYRMYIDGWNLIKIAYNLHYSERQCRRFKSEALNLLSIQFERCPLMSGFPM